MIKSGAVLDNENYLGWHHKILYFPLKKELDMGIHESSDMFTPQKRSEIMSLVLSKDTKPEIKVRKILHGLGFRFRLHVKKLPGTPDIVLPRYKTAILVNGCFWHRHKGCKRASIPKTNIKYWQQKFDRNIARDQKVKEELNKLGWKVLVIWECEVSKDGGSEFLSKIKSIKKGMI